MVLVGCPRCLMYVMLSEADPRGPKCKSTVLLDFLRNNHHQYGGTAAANHRRPLLVIDGNLTILWVEIYEGGGQDATVGWPTTVSGDFIEHELFKFIPKRSLDAIGTVEARFIEDIYRVCFNAAEKDGKTTILVVGDHWSSRRFCSSQTHSSYSSLFLSSSLVSPHSSGCSHCLLTHALGARYRCWLLAASSLLLVAGRCSLLLVAGRCWSPIAGQCCCLLLGATARCSLLVARCFFASLAPARESQIQQYKELIEKVKMMVTLKMLVTSLMMN